MLHIIGLNGLTLPDRKWSQPEMNSGCIRTGSGIRTGKKVWPAAFAKKPKA
jgi:hypothetical protein